MTEAGWIASHNRTACRSMCRQTLPPVTAHLNRVRHRTRCRAWCCAGGIGGGFRWRGWAPEQAAVWCCCLVLVLCSVAH